MATWNATVKRLRPLLNSPHPHMTSLTFTCCTRGQDRLEHLTPTAVSHLLLQLQSCCKIYHDTNEHEMGQSLLNFLFKMRTWQVAQWEGSGWEWRQAGRQAGGSCNKFFCGNGATVMSPLRHVNTLFYLFFWYGRKHGLTGRLLLLLLGLLLQQPRQTSKQLLLPLLGEQRNEKCPQVRK